MCTLYMQKKAHEKINVKLKSLTLGRLSKLKQIKLYVDSKFLFCQVDYVSGLAL